MTFGQDTYPPLHFMVWFFTGIRWLWFQFQDPPPLKSIEHASDAAWIAVGKYAKTSWWYALNVSLILLDGWMCVCLLMFAFWRWSHIPWRFVLRVDFGWFLSNIVSHIFLSLFVDNNDCTDVLWISGLKTFGRHQNNIRGQHFELVEGWKMNEYPPVN